MRRPNQLMLLLCVVVLATGASGAQDKAGPTGGQESLLGIWVPDSAPRALLTSGGKAPPLNAEASKLYAERRQRLARGDLLSPA